MLEYQDTHLIEIRLEGGILCFPLLDEPLLLCLMSLDDLLLFCLAACEP
jgi:hypothetical protein